MNSYDYKYFKSVKLRANNEFEDQHITLEMAEASKQLSQACEIVAKICAFSDDADIKGCVKDLKRLASDLVTNVVFPDMVGRYVELVDIVEYTADDLEDFQAGVVVDFLRDAISDARYEYKEWRGKEYGEII